MMKKLLLLKNNQKGMSLVEILVVILMMGILAAISAPNFFNFVQQQKLNKVNEAIQLAMKAGQNKAKKEKIIYTVEFQVNTNQELQYKIYKSLPSSSNTDAWQTISDQPQNMTVSLSDGKNITFNSNGTLNSAGELRVNEKIVVSLANFNPSSKRCAIIQTLLGSLALGKNSECN